MFRKVTLVSLVLFGLLLSWMAGECFADASANLEQAKSKVISLIEKGSYAQAQVQTQRLIADFPANPALSEALYLIARQYEWPHRFEEANNLYQQIIKDYPDSSYASKAKLGIARANVLSLIISKDYDRAKEAFDRLAADFILEPDLPETLYWIAEEYHWARRFEDANNLYQQIIKDYPDSSYASKAKLGIARANVLSLIISKDYDRAKEAFDRLAVDFILDPDLPGTLYWIAEEYKWSERFEDAKSVYQKIIRSYPDSSFADKSRLGIARAEATSLISSQNYDQAREAIGKMIADFNDHPDFPETLYWIADQYRWLDRYEDADNIYRLAIQKIPPDSPFAGKAKLGISSADVASLIASEDYNRADTTTEKLVTDFNNNPDLPSELLKIAEEYSKKAFRSEEEGRDTEAKEYFRKAITVWKRITQEFPPSSVYTPQAYHRMALCCFEHLGEYEKAIEYCKKVVENWPNYEYAWEVQFLIGNYYERLIYSGLIPESEANPKIELAYKAVVEKYPDSSNFKYASLKLAELNFKKGKWTEAAMYFELLLEKYPENQRPNSILYQLGRAYEEMGEFDLAEQFYREFIKLAYPTDPRIEDVKARLERFKAAASAKSILTDAEMSGVYGGCSYCSSYGGSNPCDTPSTSGCYWYDAGWPIGKVCMGTVVWGSCWETPKSCKYGGTHTCTDTTKPCTGYFSLYACFVVLDENNNPFCIPDFSSGEFYDCGGTLAWCHDNY